MKYSTTKNPAQKMNGIFCNILQAKNLLFKD